MTDKNYIIIISDGDLSTVLRVLSKHKEYLERLVVRFPNDSQVEQNMMMQARIRPVIQNLLSQRNTQRDEDNCEGEE